MPSLKDLHNQKKSVQSTQKITAAMKMVAGAKLRRLHQNLLESHETFAHLQEIFQRLVPHFSDLEALPAFLRPIPQDKTVVSLFIVITSDRGLCGAFNSSLLRATKKLLAAEKRHDFKLICIGKKGFEVLTREYPHHMLAHFHGLGRPKLTFTESKNVTKLLLHHLEKGLFQRCTLIYNKFKNVMTQDVMVEPLIPISLEAHPQGDLENQGLYSYEPDILTLTQELVPFLIATQLHQAILHSHTGEEGARMTAMDNATRNADKMIKKLELTYNRLRQTYITKELTEIISGAEAV